MKVRSLTEAINFTGKVQEKSDAGDQGRNSRQDQQGRQGFERYQKEELEKQASEENIDAAVKAFGGDAAAQANGLTAERDGTGPGLRVTLKDGRGAVVRQFTGEEFLKLRDAVDKGGTGRGKILDQKL